MLQFKDSQVFDEIKVFFANSQNGLFGVLRYFEQNNFKRFFPKKAVQAVYSNNYLLGLLLFRHFVQCQSIHSMVCESYHSVIECGKDCLYRLMDNPLINWRGLLWAHSKNLIASAQLYDNPYKPYMQPCLIIDDTDFEKKGKRIECIGRIWSHLHHRSILGFKCVTMCFWTGKQLLGLDFTLGCEQGKNKKIPQGMKPSELKQRYEKHRASNTCGARRLAERFESKIKLAIRMIRKASCLDIPARYVLCDSWYCCEELIKAVVYHTDYDLVCMGKWGNSKYVWNNRKLTAKQILNLVKSNKKYLKRNKDLHIKHITVSVRFKDVPLRLFFYQEKKGGKWKIVLSTDRQIGAIQAYKIYQNRWAIEVFYKEAKQYCGLGASQHRDFDGQIAAATLSIMTYNVLSSMKEQSDYSVGQLFRSVQDQFIKPNIMQRIWKVIHELIHRIGQLFEIPFSDIMNTIIKRDLLDESQNRFLLYLLSFETCET